MITIDTTLRYHVAVTGICNSHSSRMEKRISSHFTSNRYAKYNKDLSLSLFLCVCLSLSVCLSVSMSVSLCVSPCLSVCLSLSVSLCLCLSVSLCVSVCLPVCLSFVRSLSICLSFSANASCIFAASFDCHILCCTSKVDLLKEWLIDCKKAVRMQSQQSLFPG